MEKNILKKIKKKKKSLIYWMTLIYTISPLPIKKIPHTYWISLVYIIGTSSFKKNKFPLFIE